MASSIPLTAIPYHHQRIELSERKIIWKGVPSAQEDLVKYIFHTESILHDGCIEIITEQSP